MPGYLRAFGHFLWDFIVGDAPELAIGTVALLAMALALGNAGRWAGGVILPLAGTGLLAASVYIGKVQSR